MISSILFYYLVHKIIHKKKSDYYMKLTIINTLQLITEIYLTTFLANMTIYLLYELITQYSISESNLTVKHAKRIIIMKKNFLHVQ